MSEFTAGFTDAYHDDLVGMLDTGEELPLMHAPDVTVSGIPSQQAMHAKFYGEAVADLDAECPAGVAGRAEAAMGLTVLDGLEAGASIQLFYSVFHAEFPEESVGSAPTSEQEAFAAELAVRVKELVAGGYHTYNKFYFADDETGESVVVTTARIENDAQELIARELTVAVSDDLLERKLTVSELPTTFTGETALNISQSLVPVNNEVLAKAAALFDEVGVPKDMNVVVGLFSSELHGTENPEIEDLMARYEGTRHEGRLKEVLDGIKLQAASARENGDIVRSNPEVALPSAAEISDYQNLLSQMRA